MGLLRLPLTEYDKVYGARVLKIYQQHIEPFLDQNAKNLGQIWLVHTELQGNFYENHIC